MRQFWNWLSVVILIVLVIALWYQLRLNEVFFSSAELPALQIEEIINLDKSERQVQESLNRVHSMFER